MTCEQALVELRALADPRAVKVWERMGMPTDHYMGVGLTKVRDLGKKIKKDHALALELWETGIHDARLLAVMIADPKHMTDELLERWVREAEFWDLTDKLASEQVAKGPLARKKLDDWLQSDQEYIQRSAFWTLAWLAKEGKMAPPELETYLPEVKRGLQSAMNWVREAANLALIYVGSASKDLNARALAIKEEVGEVHVDYGESSCKLPDANAYLTNARLKAKLGIEG